MEKENNYIINLAGTENTREEYDFDIGKSLFDAYEGEQILDAVIKVKATLVKIECEKKINFEFKGFLSVPCDRCLEPLQVKINKKTVAYLKPMLAQQEEQEEDEDIIIIAQGENEVDLSQYIYETILLAKPMQCVHKRGECSKKMIEKLNNENKAKGEEIDPRWEALKNIKLD